nr:hypothetical protein [Candidatus Freyarchaeota archaeon]
MFLFDEELEEQTVEVRIPLTDTQVFTCRTCGREYYINQEGCLDGHYLIFSVEDVLARRRKSKVITCQKCGQEIRIRFNKKV